LGALEGQRRGLGMRDAVDRQGAVIIEPAEPADEVKSRPLLCDAERHDLGLCALARRVPVSHVQPAVAVEGVAHMLEDARRDRRPVAAAGSWPLRAPSTAIRAPSAPCSSGRGLTAPPRRTPLASR
jgi:hypothetical protein